MAERRERTIIKDSDGRYRRRRNATHNQTPFLSKRNNYMHTYRWSSSSRKTNRHRLFCVVCTTQELSQETARTFGTSAESWEKMKKPRSPTGVGHIILTHWKCTHTHILNFVFPKKQRNLRRGKKVVSVYWRIFLFVKFRKKGKLKKKRH